MPTRTTTTVLLLIVTLLACGADGKKMTSDPRRAAVKGDAQDKPDADKKAGEKKTSDEKDEQPACMHCGGTCGLVPICVCEPGTKKRPTVEFDVTCEPICVAGCGSKPWPFGRCHDRVGCTSCCAEPCRCPGWVRNCKQLKKEITDEEVPTIKRKVAYECDCCAGRCMAGCCGVGRPRRSSSWWAGLTSWMTRAPSP